KKKKEIGRLKFLRFSSGIEPDGSFYRVDDVISAIENGTGHTPYVQCNVDSDNNGQLYQVFICVDKTSGTELIDCPASPTAGRQCPATVEFPSF
ncbi:hypothetical protein M569_07538, partial [Genlisea aurea]